MKASFFKYVALGCAFTFGTACGESDPTPDAGPSADAGTTPNPIEVPTTYKFDSRFGEGSPLSYSGQIARHAILAGLTSELSAMTNKIDNENWVPNAGEVKARLNFWFRFDGETSGDMAHTVTTDPAPLQNTYNEISTKKNLVGKLAGNDSVTDYKAWATEFTGHGLNAVTSPEAFVESLFDLVDAAAVARAGGTIPVGPNGNAITKVFVTPEGHDLYQILAKFIGMGIFFSQGADDYLDSDVDGKGLKASNAQYVKDGVAKPYSALGHAWDEGFGYFGAARDYNDYTDTQAAGKGETGTERAKGYHDTDGDGKISLKSEYNFGHSRNCAKRDRGSQEGAKTDFTKDAMDAFLKGRTLILNSGDTLTAEQMTELEGYRDTAVSTWEKCIAATVVHYINDTLQDMAKFDTDGYDFHNHAKHWSELKGFALGLQFNPRSPLNAAMTEGQSYFEQFHALIGSAPALPNSDNVASYKAKLVEARTMLKDRYGFAEANMGDANGENGW